LQNHRIAIVAKLSECAMASITQIPAKQVNNERTQTMKIVCRKIVSRWCSEML